MAVSKFTSSRAQLRIQRILAQLKKKPHTAAQLAQALHMGKTTAVLYMGEFFMREEVRRVYVRDWVYGSTGAPAPLYALGNKKDKKKPEPQSNQEKNAKSWGRIKGDPERHQRHLNWRKASLLKKQTRCDPAAVWIHQARQIAA